MIDHRPIAFVTGILLCILSGFMLVPALVDLSAGNPDWRGFVIAAAITLFVGGALALSTVGGRFDLKIRQAFVLTTVLWLVIAAFGALPFTFSNLRLSYTDAFFESMSGITTTGSTVLRGLDTMAPGLLIWRSLLQWLGGIGIIVMALSILPMLRVGGMQLFRMESSDTSDKVLPRAAQIASSIGVLYLLLTMACASAYGLAGMPWFDAVAHSMTTIATGGFSTSDASIGRFNSPGIEAVATVFMLLGSLPFVLYLQAVRGDWLSLLRDRQVLWFLGIVVTGITTMTLYLINSVDALTGFEALRFASFNVVSMITGTGYATTDFGLWGPFAISAFFFMMCIGGCAGSTSCGIKIFRFQVLYASTKAQLNRLIYPSGVFIPYYNRRPIPETVAESVMSFFFMFALCFVALALGLGMLGLDFLTSVTGSLTALANVGPGLGPVIGPAGTFTGLPDTAKWLLSLGMLIGRLELFTVLVLLAPAFWKR